MQMVLSMEEVQRDILSWDFYGIVSGRATRKGLRGLTGIPTHFDSLEQYSRTFWALLLEEFRAHIQQVSHQPRVTCSKRCSARLQGPSRAWGSARNQMVGTCPIHQSVTTRQVSASFRGMVRCRL